MIHFNQSLPIVLALSMTTSAALAAGSFDTSPPKPTPTTTECADGMIWDEASEACVDPNSAALDEGTLMRAIREFAYMGQFDHARTAIDALSGLDQPSDFALTYLGFVERKLGNTHAAQAYYQQALIQNPNNLLALSYMGQGYVADGQIALARAALTQIRQKGGRGTWPEQALRLAIQGGTPPSY
ncbi:MAG: tetratricopeptide repeat protein [Primorskyibacter sp.]